MPLIKEDIAQIHPNRRPPIPAERSDRGEERPERFEDRRDNKYRPANPERREERFDSRGGRPNERAFFEEKKQNINRGYEDRRPAYYDNYKRESTGRRDSLERGEREGNRRYDHGRFEDRRSGGDRDRFEQRDA